MIGFDRLKRYHRSRRREQNDRLFAHYLIVFRLSGEVVTKIIPAGRIRSGVTFFVHMFSEVVLRVSAHLYSLKAIVARSIH